MVTILILAQREGTLGVLVSGGGVGGVTSRSGNPPVAGPGEDGAGDVVGRTINDGGGAVLGGDGRCDGSGRLPLVVDGDPDRGGVGSLG